MSGLRPPWAHSNGAVWPGPKCLVWACESAMISSPVWYVYVCRCSVSHSENMNHTLKRYCMCRVSFFKDVCTSIFLCSKPSSVQLVSAIKYAKINLMGHADHAAGSHGSPHAAIDCILHHNDVPKLRKAIFQWQTYIILLKYESASKAGCWIISLRFNLWSSAWCCFPPCAFKCECSAA